MFELIVIHSVGLKNCGSHCRKEDKIRKIGMTSKQSLCILVCPVVRPLKNEGLNYEK